MLKSLRSRTDPLSSWKESASQSALPIQFRFQTLPGRTADTRKSIDKKHRALRTRAWQRAVFEPIQMIAQVMRCSIRAVEYKLPAALKQLAAILARADLL